MLLIDLHFQQQWILQLGSDGESIFVTCVILIKIVFLVPYVSSLLVVWVEYFVLYLQSFVILYKDCYFSIKTYKILWCLQF